METLVGRYDLIEKVTSGKRRTMWRAHDTVLERSVGVLILDADHPHTDAVRRAAQQAARVETSGLLRVVDADVNEGRVFVVTRWVRGTTLATRLATGPLDPEEAAQITASVARTLAAAAAEGVHHLVLDPRDVLITDHGVVVAGIGVRAALEGVTVDIDAEQVDAWRLGALLYASLTGRWPGHSCAGLAAAPTVGGRVARPRQVRAGVPEDLDDIAWRAVQPDAATPLETPAAIAAALSGVSQPPQHRMPAVERARSPWPLVGVIAVALLLLAGVALVAWQFWQDSNRANPEPTTSQRPAATGQPTTSVGVTPPAAGEPIRIARATAFDPIGDQEENDDEAALAIDGDGATAWRTVTYASRDLGGLKPGVGLRLELDGSQPVAGIEIELLSLGTDLQIWAQRPGGAGGGGSQQPDDVLAAYRQLKSVAGAGDEVTFVFIPPVDTSAVLVWLTALPADIDEGYSGGIAEVRLTT